MALARLTYSRRRKTKGFIKIQFCILFVCCAHLTLAQTNEDFFTPKDSVKRDSVPAKNPQPKEYYFNRGVIAFSQYFVGDWLIGVGGGIYLDKPKMDIRLNFDFRPRFKDIVLQESDVLSHQYKEKDYFLNASVDKRFVFSKKHTLILPYVQVNAGLLWGNFKGFDKSPDSRFIVVPSSGVVCNPLKAFNVRLGYAYLKPLIGNSTPHKIMLQLLIYPGEEW